MGLGQNADAILVVEDLLDRTGKALLDHDFDLMQSCFRLPHLISTFDGIRLVETAEEMRVLFASVCEDFENHGVTHLDRAITELERRSDTRIDYTHVTRLYAGAKLLKEPYAVLSTAHWMGTDWRVTSSDYAVERGSSQSIALSGALKMN